MFLFGPTQLRIVAVGLIAALLLIASAACDAKNFTVKINKPKSKSTYMLSLMKLALTYSDKTYQYEPSPEVLSKSALKEAVKNGEMSVLWAGTSEQMEQDYIPVRIDGYRGLMSLRFMIIRGGEQHVFDQIQTKSDLMNIKFGQGRTWQDGKILAHSGFTVEKATKKNSLYYMLEGGRFDAFPRGATEAWKEAARFNHLSLTVETGIIISYPLPTYFFVHKGYPQLAIDIEAGLEQAMTDGQFEEYFYNNDRVIEFLKNADLDNRRVIKLTNPFLPAATPLERKELWPTIDELVEGAKRHAMAKAQNNQAAQLGLY